MVCRSFDASRQRTAKAARQEALEDAKAALAAAEMKLQQQQQLKIAVTSPIRATPLRAAKRKLSSEVNLAICVVALLSSQIAIYAFLSQFPVSACRLPSLISLKI